MKGHVRLVSNRRYFRALAALAAVAATAANVGLAHAAGDRSRATCPNEEIAGFSPRLTDCRAYEFVGPPYKGGSPVGVFAVSPDGERLVTESLGSFAESSQTSFIIQPNLYLSERSGEGWRTRAIDPSAAQYPASEYLEASADLGSSLWNLHLPAESLFTNDFYLRQPSGAFVRVGGMFPPAVTKGPSGSRLVNVDHAGSFRGASADLGHVLFSITGSTASGPSDLWAGDETALDEENQSLYEFQGVGNDTPTLVGVAGGAGSQALISKCGTELGSPFTGDVDNAVSAPGDVVFFTARHNGACGAIQPAVDELYARVGGASSLAVSEPPLSVPGRECTEACAANESDPTKRGPGVFQGASEDGRRVFFLTTQSLVNSDEGGNGAGNDLYEAQLGIGRVPEVERLIQVSRPQGNESAEVEGVARVSPDGTHVYFVARGILTTEPDPALTPADQKAQPGANNLYVYERDAAHPEGVVHFVAPLSTEDAEDWGEEDRRPVQTTQTGRYLAFVSRASLTPAATTSGGGWQIFVYDSNTGRVDRVSQGEPGFTDGNVSSEEESPILRAPVYVGVSAPTAMQSSVEVSESGGTLRVVFESAARLAPAATNSLAGCTNVYEFAAPEGAAGRVTLISDGADVSVRRGERCGANEGRMDFGGRNVFFNTGDPLVSEDTDTQGDLYDARSEGGFNSLIAPAGCEAAPCGSTAAVPQVPGPPTLTQPGEHGVSPPSRPVSARSRAQARLRRELKVCSHVTKPRRTRCRGLAERRYKRALKAIGGRAS